MATARVEVAAGEVRRQAGVLIETPAQLSWSETRGRTAMAARSLGFCELQTPACQGMAASGHHRKKRGQGGLWSPDNLLHACGSGTTGCHGHVEHHPQEAIAKGWWVREADSLATWVELVFRGHRAVWQLHDNGSITWIREL